MTKLTIDGTEIEVEAGTLVIQAAELVGAEIPRFCYHERLAVAGNCRMCLVEVSPGPPKPQASCALPVSEGMVVKTNSPMVKKAREGVMEFLLINHPLDCPICDQGGECDLQDQSMYFGKDQTRYTENKRAVPEKFMGPLVKTEMTRCIHCTRCIRFTDDIAGVEEVGATGRGEHMEITTYLEKALTSELSANVVDLCPVGALTARPYAFHARPWELKKTESIDVLDAVGSNIRVDSRGNEVMRILPRNHDDVNEEWISDKTRHACDGLKMQRLDKPYLRVNGKLKPASWDEAFAAIAGNLKISKNIIAIAGDQADAEAMFAIKKLWEKLGSDNLSCLQDGAKIDASNRASYLFNSTIAGVENADAILLIGTNPKTEAPLVNSRIRKAFLRGAKIANVGAKLELNYKYEQLGNSAKILEEILSGKNKIFKDAKNPILILGSGVLTREDAEAVQNIAQKIAEKYNAGYNVLHTAASKVAALDLGFDKPVKAAEVVYLLGADELDMKQFKNSFVIYQGSHGDAGAKAADVILPASAYTEKSGTYLNMEGRAQQTQQAVFAPAEAKEDWKIIRALSEVLGQTLDFDFIEELREKMYAENPHFGKLDEILPAKLKKPKAISQKLTTKSFEYPVKNFYMTCPISRNSKAMAECTEMLLKKNSEAA